MFPCYYKKLYHIRFYLAEFAFIATYAFSSVNVMISDINRF